MSLVFIAAGDEFDGRVRECGGVWGSVGDTLLEPKFPKVERP